MEPGRKPESQVCNIAYEIQRVLSLLYMALCAEVTTRVSHPEERIFIACALVSLIVDVMA